MTYAKSSPTSHFSSAEIRQQLDRILEYPELQSNERRQSMLRYIVEEALAGHSPKLKATSIAMDVFGRGSDFDQQMDPVVRLEARKLRRDLDHYYAGAGRNDPIRMHAFLWPPLIVAIWFLSVAIPLLPRSVIATSPVSTMVRYGDNTRDDAFRDVGLGDDFTDR